MTLLRRILIDASHSFDMILLPHDFAAANFDQCIPQLLSGLLNEHQHLEHNELTEWSTH
jgi:hypothetical protein